MGSIVAADEPIGVSFLDFTGTIRDLSEGYTDIWIIADIKVANPND